MKSRMATDYRETIIMSTMDPSNDRSTSVFVVTLVMCILSTIFTGCRMWSKWGIVKRVNVDDWLVVLAWLFCTGLSIAVMIGAKHGLGAPDSYISPEWTETLKQSIYAFATLYNPSLMATKSAILLLYLRLFTAHPILRYASYATLAIVNLAGLVLTFLNVFQCRPVVAAFTLGREGSCIDLVALYLSSAPINIITDLAVLLLPLPILTELRMEWRQKVILITTFIVGGFVTIVDIIRITYLQNALKMEIESDPTADSTISSTNQPPNFTYHASFSLMWSAVEVNVGLICACVLVLKPLVMKVLPSLLGRRRRSIAEVMSGRKRSEGEERGDGPPRKASISLSEGSKEPKSPRQPLGPIMEDTIDFPTQIGIAEYSPRTPHPATFTSDHERDITEEETGGGDMDFFEMLSSGPAPTESIHSSPPQHFSPIFPSLTRNVTNNRKGSIQPRLSAGSKGAMGTVDMVDASQGPSQTFFDFVNMNSRKGLTELSEREAWWPILFVSTLFFPLGLCLWITGHVERRDSIITRVFTLSDFGSS